MWPEKIQFKFKIQISIQIQNSNILEMWETGLKNTPRQTASVLCLVRCHQHTDIFAPAHPPVGQKMSILNFKHKIMTSANYKDGIG